MTLYHLRKPAGPGHSRDGVEGMLVSAINEATAKSIASRYFNGDGGWSGATATTIAEVVDTTDLMLVGWTFTIRIEGGAAQTVDPFETSYTAIATADSYAEIAAALVALLAANTDTAHAAFAAPTLTISSIADGIGDATVTITVTPPADEYEGAAKGVTGVLTVSHHEGIAAAALDADFAAAGSVRPTVLIAGNEATGI